MRRGDEESQDQQRPHDVERGDDREAQECEQYGVREARAQSQGAGLARVERQGEEGPVAEDRDGRRHQQSHPQQDEVLLPDGEDVTEQEAGQINGEGL